MERIATGIEGACIASTRGGRGYHCPELRRLVLDFNGTYLVLRHWEFLRLQRYFSRMASCGWSRVRLDHGERIRLRDATGGGTLVLSIGEVLELAELMDSTAAALQARLGQEVLQDP
jgi:hypothetical protein